MTLNRTDYELKQRIAALPPAMRASVTEILEEMMNGSSRRDFSCDTLTATTDVVVAGVSLTGGELGVLDGVTAGTLTASRAAVVDANKDLLQFRNLYGDNLVAGHPSGRVGTVNIHTGTARGVAPFVLDASDNGGDRSVHLHSDAHGQETVTHIGDPGAAASYLMQTTSSDGATCTASAAEVNTLDGVQTPIALPADGVRATATLTVAGGQVITPGSHASSVFTTTGVFTDGETVVIGATTYRIKETMTQANDVQLAAAGAAAETLDNLKAAINGTGTAGVEWYAGTVANATVVATTNTDTAQTVIARVPGTAANTAATTDTCGNASWPAATLGDGAGDSTPGVASETVTVAGVTYAFVDALSESSGAAAIANQVLFGADTAAALDNLKLAVNAGATIGTNYSTGTVVHPLVTAETNANDSQVFQAVAYGTAGNAYASTETCAQASFGDTVFTGGVDVTAGAIGSWRFKTSDFTEGYVKVSEQVWKKFALSAV